MKNYFYYNFNGIGRIGIGEENGNITDLHFERGSNPSGEITIFESPLIKRAAEQIGEYLSGARRFFDLPLDMYGTDFQVRCWKALLDIPYGETRSYKDIAKAAGSPNAFRAAGMANNRNHIAIIIPCHRVIGADGKLVGFGGGLDIKSFLLELERGYAHH